MRVLLVLIAFGMIAVPALIALARRDLPRGRRIGTALVIFLAPAAALGLIHGKWKMVPGRFKDYISTPKPNGYRSLHTTVIGPANQRIEMQIRTREMHEEADLGVAAHWGYKAGRKPGEMADVKQFRWLRELLDIIQQEKTEDIMESTKMELFQDMVYCFTPKGDLIELPSGACPVDFAYAVHTRLGNQTVGAKVNGRVVPLRTSLENGDQVEILKSAGQEPQPGWLTFAVTGKARASIRRYIRQKQRGEEVALGEKLYEEIVGRFSPDLAKELGDKALIAALKRLKLEDRASLMVAIATHRLLDSEVMEALVPGSTSGEGMEASGPQLLVATLIAFVVGYASIAWLLQFVSKHSMNWFGGYRIILGVTIIILLATGAVSAT